MDLPFGWLGAVQNAWNETFPYEGDEEMSLFEDRWGTLDLETLRRVFHEGQGKDKVFAIFAVGALAIPEMLPLISSTLQSSNRMERWASIISLARFKDEQAFLLVQSLLLEGILDYGPFLAESIESSNMYIWYNMQRCNAASILGNWGDLQVVPVLYHALDTCWRLEQRPGPFDGRWGIYRDNWHAYQDQLAYALGKLEAFGSLSRLELPPERLCIATMYMILGYLGTPLTLSSFGPRFFLLTTSQEKQVAKILAQRFGLSTNEQMGYIQQFTRNSEEREVIEERLFENN